MTTKTEVPLEEVGETQTLAQKIAKRIEKEKVEKKKKEGHKKLAKTIMESLGITEPEALQIVRQEEEDLDTANRSKNSIGRGATILKNMGVILPTVISVDYWNKIEKMQEDKSTTQIEKLIEIIKTLDTSKKPHGVIGANIKKLDFKDFQDMNEAVEEEMKKSQDKKK